MVKIGFANGVYDLDCCSFTYATPSNPNPNHKISTHHSWPLTTDETSIQNVQDFLDSYKNTKLLDSIVKLVLNDDANILHVWYGKSCVGKSVLFELLKKTFNFNTEVFHDETMDNIFSPSVVFEGYKCILFSYDLSVNREIRKKILDMKIPFRRLYSIHKIIRSNEIDEIYDKVSILANNVHVTTFTNLKYI